MISIILYTSGKDREIFSTLQSVRDLAFKDYELIIICNACTSDVLNDMKIADAKVLAFKTFKSPGLAKNEAVSRVKNEIMVFIDSGVKLQEGILEEIIKTKDNWVVGSCKITASGDKPEYEKVFNFINKFLIPNAYDNGFVFCKKTTFEVLGRFNIDLLTNVSKDLITRFKKMGNHLVIDIPIIYPTRDFENKTGLSTYMLTLKKFLVNKNKQEIPENSSEHELVEEEEL